MLLLDALSPAPRIVCMFLDEKGLVVPSRQVDVFTGENRHAPYLAHNPAGQTPTLLLDDGTSIAESISIMEYLEELYPSPALIGVSARQRDGDTAMAAAHRTQHHREHPQRVSLCRRIGALS